MQTGNRTVLRWQHGQRWPWLLLLLFHKRAMEEDRSGKRWLALQSCQLGKGGTFDRSSMCLLERCWCAGTRMAWADGDDTNEAQVGKLEMVQAAERQNTTCCFLDCLTVLRAYLISYYSLIRIKEHRLGEAKSIPLWQWCFYQHTDSAYKITFVRPIMSRFVD